MPQKGDFSHDWVGCLVQLLDWLLKNAVMNLFAFCGPNTMPHVSCHVISGSQPDLDPLGSTNRFVLIGPTHRGSMSGPLKYFPPYVPLSPPPPRSSVCLLP
jgi:hypothetical protein